MPATHELDPSTEGARIRQLLSPKQTASILGVTVGSLAVWRCVKRHALAYVRVGRRGMYRPEDVEAFIAARTVSGLAEEPSAKHGRRSRKSGAGES